MSRVRIQLEGCLPWNPNLVLEAVYQLFPKIEFLSYEEAKEFARKLGIKSKEEWERYCKSGKKPNSIPSTPYRVYRFEWMGWGDFLGTGNISSKDRSYLSFEETREFLRKLDIKSKREWREYCKSGNKPINIPSAPSSIYKDKGWISWGDFLGTGNIHTKDFLSFEEARAFVRKLNLKTNEEWVRYSASDSRPKNIPSSPWSIYEDDGWAGIKNWLGTELVSFEESKTFARKLKLKSSTEWKKYRKTSSKPSNIPSAPDAFYKDTGWISWSDFLGTGNISNINKNKAFLLFEKAREFVRKLNLRTYGEWYEYCKSGKRSINIPIHPHRTYKNKGWISWQDFLGTAK